MVDVPLKTCKVWLITGTQRLPYLCVWISYHPLTSGATSGLGLALTRNVIARGDNVIATGRSASRLDDLLSDSSIDQTRLRVLALDVTAPIADIKRQVDSAIHVWGRIDVLVNNAGIATFGAIEEVGFVRSIHQLYWSSQKSNTDGLQGRGDDGRDASQLFRCRECDEYGPPSHA
jgi:hypothetical protein